MHVPFLSQVIKIPFLIVCISFLMLLCLHVCAFVCACICGHQWVQACPWSFVCVLLLTPPFLPPCHSVLLCLFFNFTNFCSDSHQPMCTHRHMHTPLYPLTTISQSETQALLGTHSHRDTYATGTVGNGKRILVILPGSRNPGQF